MCVVDVVCNSGRIREFVDEALKSVDGATGVVVWRPNAIRVDHVDESIGVATYERSDVGVVFVASVDLGAYDQRPIDRVLVERREQRFAGRRPGGVIVWPCVPGVGVGVEADGDAAQADSFGARCTAALGLSISRLG